MSDLNEPFEQLQSLQKMLGHVTGMEAEIAQGGETVKINQVLQLTNGLLRLIAQQLMWLQVRAMNADIEAQVAALSKNPPART